MKKYKTLKDHVYDYIAEQILDGNLIPSQRINETAISQELSVSRTPVSYTHLDVYKRQVNHSRVSSCFKSSRDITDISYALV